MLGQLILHSRFLYKRSRQSVTQLTVSIKNKENAKLFMLAQVPFLKNIFAKIKPQKIVMHFFFFKNL